jgi:lipoprotein-releasing system ATP-binding protein
MANRFTKSILMGLELSNISKKYQNLTVLDSISLAIETGKITVIVGPSGAGKSTLLQILGTLELPDSGTIIYDSQNVNELKASKLATFRNENIGFVFQFHHLLPEFTALENVCIPAFIQSTSKKEAEERAELLLTMLGLKERMNHKPNQLSGGEQQRVAVARAMMNSPKVILADEPSGNLDSANAKALHELFFKLRDEWKQTFVIVTHNEELAAMADRVIKMQDGKILV